ncbi:MAG: hypothetical protein IKQ16_09870 [Lentisphaeria bacterium]|nr:hypothetical protein [Lentisphaeria bacterium]
MKNSNIINTQKTAPKLTFTTVIVMVLAMLPVLLFAMTRMIPPVDNTTEKATVSEAETKRTSAAERRAQRAETRKAKKAEKAATTSVQHGMAPDPGMASFPMPPMEPMEFNGGFGPGMGFDNGMAMGPGMGGFGGGFGSGAMGGGFGPGMGGNFGMF